MHPTNLQAKYETIVRDFILVLGNDVSDELEYVVVHRGTSVSIWMAVTAYDGLKIMSAPMIQKPFPNKQEVESLVKEGLDAIRSKIQAMES